MAMSADGDSTSDRCVICQQQFGEVDQVPGRVSFLKPDESSHLSSKM